MLFDAISRLIILLCSVRRLLTVFAGQRLLKALGYLSSQDRPPQVDEEIQMHADALYQRIAQQEAAIEEAKRENKPIPTFAPVIAKAAPRMKENDIDISTMHPDAQKKWREQLEKVPEEDRQAEEEAMKAELRAKAELASQVQGLWQEQAKEREARKAEGKETVYDKVVNLIGKK